MPKKTDWLAAILTPQEIGDLGNPLWLDEDGKPCEGPVSTKLRDGKFLPAKAFIDPTLFFSDGREASHALLHRPYPLTEWQVLQAARFTAALLKVNRALTNHETIAIHTFLEVLIASTGVFPFYDGKLAGLYKQQTHIGRGTKVWRVGRAGRFILPNLRMLVRDVTMAQFLKEMGVELDINRLNPFAPDHLIEKLDYDMTWRNRNYGFVFSYTYFPTQAEWAAWQQAVQIVNMKTKETVLKPVLVLSGNDPHPTDAELEKHHHVLRLMGPEDMERLDAEGRLTLEAEKPRLLEMFERGMNYSPEERMLAVLEGIPEAYRAQVLAGMKDKFLI